jgi:hypothetical protein
MDLPILNWLKLLLPDRNFDSILMLRDGNAFAELLHLVSEEEFPLPEDASTDNWALILKRLTTIYS